MLRSAIAAVRCCIAAVSAEPAAAQRVKAGVLTCDVSAGIGYHRVAEAGVLPVRARPAGPAAGLCRRRSREFGLDIGVTAGGVMVWARLQRHRRRPRLPGRRLCRCERRGDVAAGLGANVLVGGSNRTVALQPLSVQGQVGLNFAVGVGDLQLASRGRR